MATMIIGNPAALVKGKSPAAQMPPSQRQSLAVEGIARSQPVGELAKRHGVSRKFVYTLMGKGRGVLESEFSPEEEDQRVLFHIPVTKPWVQQVVLCCLLHCHSSYRGVIDLLRDICQYKISVGGIHDIVAAAVEKARLANQKEDLSPIRVGAHDEIFQGDPVLVGVDPFSTFCYLLAQESSRDADTWGVHLLDLSQRGLSLEYTVADAGSGLRAGQAEAWPTVPCRGDVFHAECQIGRMATWLENRAYGCIAARDELERKMQRAKKRNKGQHCLSSKLYLARKEEATALQLADDVRLLAQWMREDVLSLTGPDAQTRRLLFDFIVEQIQLREHLAPKLIRAVRVALKNQRDQLLAFAEDIDRQLAAIAKRYQVPLQDVRQVFQAGRFAPVHPGYWHKDTELWKRLGRAYPLVRRDVEHVKENTVRASSMIENLNSRLRCYFFLRRHIGPEYLEILRFFLNHRRYPRSRKDPHAGKSPAEILQGKFLPHWLDQLGFQRFRKTG